MKLLVYVPCAKLLVDEDTFLPSFKNEIFILVSPTPERPLALTKPVISNQTLPLSTKVRVLEVSKRTFWATVVGKMPLFILSQQAPSLVAPLHILPSSLSGLPLSQCQRSGILSLLLSSSKEPLLKTCTDV